MNDFNYSWIVVGAGFTGASFARLKAEQGHRVLVMERRPHVAGNAYDRYVGDSSGMEHVYGPHIFHTNSAKVFGFLSAFTDWRIYTHYVKAQVEGRNVPVPVNFNTITALFTPQVAEWIIEDLIKYYGYNKKVMLSTLMDDKNSAHISTFANYVYSNIVKNYTEKQWGVTPDQLSDNVLARFPVRLNIDDRYFTDEYQCMPTNGYTQMFQAMLDHPNIQVMLGADFKQLVKIDELPEQTSVLYTGCIDEFYDYDLGLLEYRSLKFTTTDGKPLECATLNMPSDPYFTRVTDQTILNHSDNGHNVNHAVHTLTYEASLQYELDKGLVPYYPMQTDKAKDLYRQYENRPDKHARVHFAGRLGSFQYLNMDQACAQGMHLANTL